MLTLQWLCWWACRWAHVVVCRVCSVLAWCWGPVVTNGKDTEVTDIAGITLHGFPFTNPCPSYAVGIRTMVVCQACTFSLGRSFLFFSAYYPFLCTILRPQSMTPGITCDSKSPMTDWLGPLARPRFPVRYLADSRARPSPLWAYNTFSYVLFLSFRLAFYSMLFHSIPLRL